MKYRIKNEAVEHAVRRLFKTQEAYEKALFETCTKQLHDPYILMNMPISSKDSLTGVITTIGLLKTDIEEFDVYDPKKWNQWPQVRPIKKGNYRIEHDENGYTYKFGFYWNGHFWEGRKGYGPICSNTFQDGFRFKPWYDEWEDRE